MKHKYGFTIVELIVVTVVIGIVITTGITSYVATQKQSRDGQRTASATIIADSLEKYFEKNGEYPSVAKITATNANTPKALLELDNLDSFIMPRAPAGTTTNLWKAGAASNINRLTYTGNTDISASCLTGSTAADVCDDYRIQYYVEETNTVTTLMSRNKAATPPVAAPAPAAPAVTTLVVALGSNKAVATTSVASCAGSAGPEYAFRSRTNDGTWSSYTAWDPATTNSSAVVTQGTKYGFQVKGRCVDGTLVSPESPVSTEATYTHLINTPSAPVLTVTPAADNQSATWSWSATSCPAGTTAQYVTQFYRDDPSAWRAYNFGATQTTTSVLYATNYEGYDHRARVQARCVSASANSSWSTDSNSPAFISPVTTPDVATNFRWTTYNSSPLFTWTESSCGLGTQQERRYWTYVAGTQYFSNGSSSENWGATDIFNATRPGADALLQWENTAGFAASQLDMAVVNQRGYAPVASAGAGWIVNVGSPNTNSQNDHHVRTVVQLRCYNTTTGRNALGNYIMSGMFAR